MLIQKITQCPKGCQNATISESSRVVEIVPSNLLLEGGNQSATQTVKVYACNCCGTTFETKEKSDGRLVL